MKIEKKDFVGLGKIMRYKNHSAGGGGTKRIGLARGEEGQGAERAVLWRVVKENAKGASPYESNDERSKENLLNPDVGRGGEGKEFCGWGE